MKIRVFNFKIIKQKKIKRKFKKFCQFPYFVAKVHDFNVNQTVFSCWFSMIFLSFQNEVSVWLNINCMDPETIVKQPGRWEGGGGGGELPAGESMDFSFLRGAF